MQLVKFPNETLDESPDRILFKHIAQKERNYGCHFQLVVGQSFNASPQSNLSTQISNFKVYVQAMTSEESCIFRCQ